MLTLEKELKPIWVKEVDFEKGDESRKGH